MRHTRGSYRYSRTVTSGSPSKRTGSSWISQWTPSLLKPGKMSMLTERLSQRNTPAKPSPKGTTALLNTLLDRLVAWRPMMGLPV